MTGTRAAAALLIAAAVFALAGCKGADRRPGIATAGGSGSAPASAAPAADQEQRARQFAQCLRDNGIDAPDPDPETGVKGVIVGAPAGDKQALNSAMERCQRYLPDGGEPKRLSPETLERLRRHAQCMRDHGVEDWPDPDPDGNVRADAGPQLDKNSPTLRAAFDACNDILGQPEGRSGDGGGK